MDLKCGLDSPLRLNLTLQRFAEGGADTVVIPANIFGSGELDPHLS